MRCIFCVETSPLDTIDEAVILQIKELNDDWKDVKIMEPLLNCCIKG